MWKIVLSYGIKALCYVGWHMWEYVYKDDGSSYRRKCKTCGITHVKHVEWRDAGDWEEIEWPD